MLHSSISAANENEQQTTMEASERITTPNLHITAGFVRTDSDVPSLSVMSLKMKK